MFPHGHSRPRTHGRCPVSSPTNKPGRHNSLASYHSPSTLQDERFQGARVPATGFFLSNNLSRSAARK